MQMISSKSRSGLSDVVNSKNTPGGKIGRLGSVRLEVDSPSPRKTPGFSNDVSPRSADSKPVPNRRSPKNSAAPDKQSRPAKGSELQLQLAAAQEDLLRAKEQLTFEEKEKARVLEELSEARKAAEEVSERLAETLLAQRKAEEASELDKFRADELEQSAIEAAQRREKEWDQVLEDVRNQHAVDAAALVSATEELRKANHQLEIAIDEKNAALSNANDAMKIAEVNTEKAEVLSDEINRLQSLLDSKLESKSSEAARRIAELGSEVDCLKHELEAAKRAEEKLVEMEALVERLEIDLADTTRAESDAYGLVDHWTKRAELFESYLEEAKQSERSVQDSLASSTKQLDETKSMLDDAESEIISLRGKVEALELEVARHEADHEKSDGQLNLARREVSDLEKAVEVLKSEMQRAEDEKARASSGEKIASSNLEILSQEKGQLAVELEIAREDSERAKNAMEGLVSALHEVSAEARDMKERLSIKQAEIDNATADADKLKLALKNTQEKHELALDEAKYEILCLKKAIDKSETEAKDLRDEWDEKEINLSNAMKKTGDEITSIMLERDKALETLEMKLSEEKAAGEEASRLLDSLRRAESELFAANDAMAKAKEESERLRERLLDKENELQSIAQENDDLWVRDNTASETIKELSESLAKLSSKKEGNDGHGGVNAECAENGDVLLPAMIEAGEDKVIETKSEDSEETPLEETREVLKEALQPEGRGSEKFDEWNRLRMKLVISESDADDKPPPSETERRAESIDDEPDAKVDGTDQDKAASALSVQNGSTSPTERRRELAKKKKPLLSKFGSLLKKKNSPK